MKPESQKGKKQQEEEEKQTKQSIQLSNKRRGERRVLDISRVETRKSFALYTRENPPTSFNPVTAIHAENQNKGGKTHKAKEASYSQKIDFSLGEAEIGDGSSDTYIHLSDFLHEIVWGCAQSCSSQRHIYIS